VVLVALDPSKHRLDLGEFSDAEWDELRRLAPPLTCQGCGGPMHTAAIPLTSPLPGEPPELRIFRHNPGAAEACRLLGHDESPQHDRLKRRLAAGARAAGWSTAFEVRPSPDCQADVVATSPRGTEQYALEAQLASLSLANAVRRHSMYEREFGHCTWTHTGSREWASQIPSMRIDSETQTNVTGGILIDLVNEITAPPEPIVDVIPKVLTNRLRYVYMGDWGSWVAREALGGGSPRLPRRRRARSVNGEHIRRFCERVRSVGPSAQALLQAGFPSIEQLLDDLEAGHQLIRDSRTTSVSERQWNALALAYEHPELKVVIDPDALNRQLDALTANWN
jgi:hypothetical protein